MSDLQEIIARQAVIAFNAGLRAGKQEQINKIMELAKAASTDDNSNIMGHDRVGDYVYLSDLLEYMKETTNES